MTELVEMDRVVKDFFSFRSVGVSLFTVKKLENGMYRFVEGARDGEEITQAELDALIDMVRRV